jgi:hypothetical protein
MRVTLRERRGGKCSNRPALPRGAPGVVASEVTRVGLEVVSVVDAVLDVERQLRELNRLVAASGDASVAARKIRAALQRTPDDPLDTLPVGVMPGSNAFLRLTGEPSSVANELLVSQANRSSHFTHVHLP